ncbi:MAG TPA: hypothetical protein VNV17_22555 [Solirubrobacteraceae bacterium]|jgi:hypothetical protein|nr:hypothetical protein [Solirubrobacteraceae bacterium]
MTSRFSRFARCGRVGSDDIPASPPPEVLEAIARAHEAYERLEASGRHVHFDFDQASGALAIELTDALGTPLRSLSPRTVLELAAGAALD